MTDTTAFAPKLRTGDYVDVCASHDKAPGWAVIDKNTGSVITFANTRDFARQMADHKQGERIAKVHSVTYEVSH
jgi:hypothetical protein